MPTKILVIEDEDETREIFLRSLAFEQFNAMGAKDGETGVELAMRHRPDLIICDIMMPQMDGYGVLTKLRSQEKTLSIPFIFLTAKVTMEELRLGMGLGADDYLTKPCTIEQFLSAISTRLRRNQEIREPSKLIPQPTYPPTQPNALSDIFPDCPKLRPVFQFIDNHYQQPIYLSDIAQAAGYSPAYLTNLAQSHTGKTIKRWITERRMAQARRLLKDKARSVKQISEEIGYADAGYFTRQFRKLHDVTPKVWREKNVL
ncbi:MAG: Response regulators consisting of a CheY-like receiver domain and a winged-helix DNA-binding domain [Phormidesmis priestleyi Ana]|uniref:Response regulators consisting of a CheY-like receiver domain and a winged-helix DNA-binding domain n=1 Tax=Phormidesmis priestleyi Ana TaxID=1666911 RepID=A0A0P8BJ13_9CYAN|nr:MAG: Response regulators consisting of a CheY-like receiver domain and a winged-helix DNA-binding domain [Phormidesmis priestleyi Ana]